MTTGTTETTMHPTTETTDPDAIARLGGWLFKQRSWLPVPIVIALLAIPAPSRPSAVIWAGVALVAVGEGLRLWAVHHIGVISRTRAERLGPLISTGPFGHVRNPLYLGNIALWLGFTISAGLLWLAPIALLLLVLEYHAIVRWEEGLLASRMGPPYQQYLRAVSRWVPMLRPASIDSGTAAANRGGESAVSRYSWRDTLVSERSTLVALVVGYILLWAKG